MSNPTNISPEPTITAPSTETRVLGYDLARALALFGLVIFDYKAFFGAKDGSNSLLWLIDMFDGKAAALFAVLAGVGVTLYTQEEHYMADINHINRRARTMAVQAVMAFLIGLGCFIFWQGELLTLYGLCLLVSLAAIHRSSYVVLLSSFIMAAVFPILYLIQNDYAAGWLNYDWRSLVYTDFWTYSGMTRHIFYNGFYPLFPWVSMFLLGVWLGRLNVRDENTRNKLIITWGVLALMAGVVSEYGMRFLGGETKTVHHIVRMLLTVEPMPPGPMFVLASMGTAVVAILFCVVLGERYGKKFWTKPLASVGKISLSLYVIHLMLGMSIARTFHVHASWQIQNAMLFAVTVCGIFVVVAYVWCLKFKHGPLELVLRNMQNMFQK